MTTEPKSIQALAGNGLDADKRQRIKEFLSKYKRLPDDFLRVTTSNNIQHQLVEHRSRNDHIIAAGQNAAMVDLIEISVVEAQLVKNYGLLRMDLYCKLRVGHMVCETNTSQNCAKNPKWSGIYQFTLKPGIDSFHLEVYDEKQFSLDEKIAWLHHPIPPEVFQGITVERWFPLSGRLGKDKEGSVLLVLSHKTRVLSRQLIASQELHMPQHVPIGTNIPSAAILPVDPYVQIPHYVQPPPVPISVEAASHGPESAIIQQNPNQQLVAGGALQVREEDVSQLSEMFPSISRDIIKTILENNNNDKDATISTLLAMG